MEPEAYRFPLGEFIGLAIEIPEPGTAIARVRVTDQLRNVHGYLHGAVLFAMVDTGMGAATMSLLEPDQRCVTVEIQTRFLRPVEEGALAAEVHVLNAGRRLVHLQADVTNGGQRVAAATGTFSIVSR